MPNAINRQLVVKKNVTLCSRHDSGWASSFVLSPPEYITYGWKCQCQSVNLSAVRPSVSSSVRPSDVQAELLPILSQMSLSWQ